MPTPDDVIAFFERHNGLQESPANSNCTWISRWFWEQTDRHSALAPGCYAWCATTVSRALNEAWGDPDVWQVPGISPDWGPGFSYVPSVRSAFARAGRFHATATGGVKGDLVIYDWDGDGWGDHIGVFVGDVDGETCLVWEGNTSSNDLSLRRRPYSLIAGFCRPPYDIEEEDPLAALEPEEQRELLDKTRYSADVLTELKEAFAELDPSGNGDWHAGRRAFPQLLKQAAIGGVAGAVRVEGTLNISGNTVGE